MRLFSKLSSSLQHPNSHLVVILRLPLSFQRSRRQENHTQSSINLPSKIKARKTSTK
jgi:hypothetical protein